MKTDVNFWVVLPRAEVNPGSHSGFPVREREGEKEGRKRNTELEINLMDIRS